MHQRPMHLHAAGPIPPEVCAEVPYPRDPSQSTALLHIERSGHVDADDDLATLLRSAWRKLHTRSRRPPCCPRCQGNVARFDGNDVSGLPQFFCLHCHRRFNRLTGTPMARLKAPAKLWAYFGLVGRPMQLADCARQLDIRYETVVNWSLQTRLWLLSLDATGSWERRVQLGVHYAVVPASTLEGSSPGLQGCQCVVMAGAGAATPEGSQAPLLMRVCARCELAGRPHAKAENVKRANQIQERALR